MMTTPPDQVRYLMAKGSPSTPAPTMAVVLWNALQTPHTEDCINAVECGIVSLCLSG